VQLTEITQIGLDVLKIWGIKTVASFRPHCIYEYKVQTS